MNELFNANFEQNIIGALLIDSNLFADVSAILSPADFRDDTCAHAFAGIADLVQQGRAVDFVTLADELERLRPAGWWLKFLAEVSRNCPSTANIDEYANSVAQYSTLRKLHAAGQSVCQSCFDPNLQPHEKIARAQQAVLDVIKVKSKRGPKSTRESLRNWLDHLESCAESGGNLTGHSTGFPALDDRTAGLHGGELLVLAARPGQGKTVMALNISGHFIRADKNVLFFSLEMSEKELIGRLASAMTGTYYRNIQTADLDQAQWSMITGFVSEMRDKNIFIDDDGDVNIADIRARARSLARTCRLDLIVVDYLQLVGGTGENETVKVGNVSRGLKQMAKELDCPVLALSQLNRGIESRPDPRPRLSDLRASGAIEQDADAVMFLHGVGESTTELITEKLRHGQPGSDWLEKQFHQCRFIPGREYIPPIPAEAPPKHYARKAQVIEL